MPGKGKTQPLRGKMVIRTADPVMRTLFTIAHQRGLTLDDIGKKTANTARTISNWRQGKSTPSILDANIFAQAIGCSITVQDAA